ncbi:MAG: 2-iminoacetate synthase ThiH [Actinobacteria bacterium]|nr:2-iminoacetate synthase ThiH [Actinomycetota bacterium]
MTEFALDVRLLDELSSFAEDATVHDVERALASERRDLFDVAALVSPCASEMLEDVARTSRAETVRRFGRTMHLFAPLYLSNECVSECTYCGFQVWNRDIVRRTLEPHEVRTETRYLKHLGFRHVLLVAGEHPKHVSADYIVDCIVAAADEVSDVSVEVQVWDEETYARFVRAGCDGLVVYQECYDPRVYPKFHLKGPKRHYDNRLAAPDRAAAAGMRRIGLGSLLGLNPDWRFEVLALVMHARFGLKHWWRSDITVALPRLEPAAGFDAPPAPVDDRDFTLALCALRLALPDVGIVLSTREPSRLRDGLASLGVTHMSAGSRTEPGGYTEPGGAEQQFEISDVRSPDEVRVALARSGLDPVWKDASPVFRRATSGDRI